MERESTSMEITDASFIPANGKHGPEEPQQASSLSRILSQPMEKSKRHCEEKNTILIWEEKEESKLNLRFEPGTWKATHCAVL